MGRSIRLGAKGGNEALGGEGLTVLSRVMECVLPRERPEATIGVAGMVSLRATHPWPSGRGSVAGYEDEGDNTEAYRPCPPPLPSLGSHWECSALLTTGVAEY